jgi:hypothetical protein
MGISSKSRTSLPLLYTFFKKTVDPIKNGSRSFIRWLFSANGITITLLLGVFINLFSDQVSRVIAIQRYKELLSYEMRSNTLQFGQVQKAMNNQGNYTLEIYIHDEVYKSGIDSGYIFDIETNMLSEILALYSITPAMNSILKVEYDQMRNAWSQWINCLNLWSADVDVGSANSNENSRCEFEQAFYEHTLQTSSKNIYSFWENYYDETASTSAKFNPTQTRLNSPILKFLMGVESLEFLK